MVDVDLLVGSAVDVANPQGWVELAGGCEVGVRLQVRPVLLHLKCVRLSCVHNFSSEQKLYNLFTLRVQEH